MREPMRLDGVVALEIDERLDETVAGRIAVDDCGNVGAKSLANLRIGRKRPRKFGDDRRTKVVKGGAKILSVEDMIADEDNAHIARSLAAKEMQAQHSEWGAGTLVVIAMALLAILISVVLVLVRK